MHCFPTHTVLYFLWTLYAVGHIPLPTCWFLSRELFCAGLHTGFLPTPKRVLNISVSSNHELCRHPYHCIYLGLSLIKTIQWKGMSSMECAHACKSGVPIHSFCTDNRAQGSITKTCCWLQSKILHKHLSCHCSVSMSNCHTEDIILNSWRSESLLLCTSISNKICSS